MTHDKETQETFCEKCGVRFLRVGEEGVLFHTPDACLEWRLERLEQHAKACELVLAHFGDDLSTVITQVEPPDFSEASPRDFWQAIQQLRRDIPRLSAPSGRAAWPVRTK